MASPTHPVLQQIQHLDHSAPDFHNLLNGVLHEQEYTQCMPDLGKDDLLWLVCYLDQAIDKLDPLSPASRKCLRELKTICEANAILPPSYTLSPDLLKVDAVPFASGGFGDIYRETFNGPVVCAKRLEVFTQEGIRKAEKGFCKEAVMWKHLTHPNIVPLIGVTISPHQQLISDWMPGGKVCDHIKYNHGADRLGLLSDAAKGLEYLHSRNMIHGDLKGLNILVDIVNDSPRVRLADFGVAIVTRNLNSIRPATRENNHTERWAAPKVLSGENASRESDIFSFAMVMVEVFTGQDPFNDKLDFSAVVAILNGDVHPRPTHPACTDVLWAMMQHCWNHDPMLRPTISEVL